MSVLPAYPGLTVELMVNGQPLQEYDNDDEEAESPNTTAKYIEAQSGTQFSVRYTSSQLLPEPEFTVRIFLNGTKVEGSVYRNSRYKFKLNDPYIKKGRVSLDGQQTVVRAFQFSEINIGKFGFAHPSEVTQSDKLLVEKQ